ncbi:hypothetical protein H6F87_03080 [Cyanobacteria bacterium FACHB-502]|nr:hypothetical protein [Cyanobacteria bacterium FACHB-502]MBD2023711.1 hypothetical protein [Leptolyngbya sp. FACHB-711]
MPPESMPQESMPGVKIPTSLLLSLGTIPVLAVLLGSKAVLQVMREVGEASEEIFRGDRLPILELETQNSGQVSERSGSSS